MLKPQHRCNGFSFARLSSLGRSVGGIYRWGCAPGRGEEIEKGKKKKEKRKSRKNKKGAFRHPIETAVHCPYCQHPSSVLSIMTDPSRTSRSSVKTMPSYERSSLLYDTLLTLTIRVFQSSFCDALLSGHARFGFVPRTTAIYLPLSFACPLWQPCPRSAFEKTSRRRRKKATK